MKLKTTTALSLACVLACGAPAFAQSGSGQANAAPATSGQAVSGPSSSGVVIAQGPGPRTGFGTSGYSKGSPWGDAGGQGSAAKPSPVKPSPAKPSPAKPTPAKPTPAKPAPAKPSATTAPAEKTSGDKLPAKPGASKTAPAKDDAKKKSEKRSSAPETAPDTDAPAGVVVQASLNSGEAGGPVRPLLSPQPEATSGQASGASGAEADAADAAKAAALKTPAPRFAARAPLPPVRPASLDEEPAQAVASAAPGSASSSAPVEPAPVASVEARPEPVAPAQQVAVAPPVEVAPPASSGGGFDLMKFLSGKPQHQPVAGQSAAGEEQPRRGRRHARGEARDAGARAQIAPLIERHARANGIPVSLADAVIRVESRYNAAARNGPYLGLSQIHLNTARSMGYGGGAQGLLDADTNLRYGMKYLATAYRLAGGDTCRTIMKYQGGHRTERLSSHAARYCSRVRVMMAAH